MLGMNEGFRGLLKIFLLNKSLLLAVSVLAVAFVPLGAGYKINTPSIVNPWAQWDGEAYLTIAQKGYVTLPDGRTLHNFLPLYPFVIRLAGFIIPDLAFAAIMLSALFSFIAVYFMFLLAEKEFGGGVARKSIILLLFFPTAFFLSAVYTESMFLAFAIPAFYYARKGSWIRAGLLAAALPFIRIVGLLFLPVLALEYFTHGRGIKSRDILGLAIPLIGTVSFFLFSLYNTGTLFGYANQQNLWTRSISPPYVALIDAFQLLFFREGLVLALYSFWNLAVLSFFLLTFYYAVRHLPRSYAAYMFLMMFLPLLSSTLEGFSRFVLISFPSFIILAKYVHDKNKFYLPLLILSASLLILLAARFVTGAVATILGA